MLPTKRFEEQPLSAQAGGSTMGLPGLHIHPALPCVDMPSFAAIRVDSFR